MSKTKTKILTEAQKLFNTRGYYQVTIRQIAESLNMSSGNLNYHFKKREQILEALYFNMVKDFDSRIEDLDKQTFSLNFIHSEIKRSMDIMVDYSFFWTDIYHLIKDNQQINEHFSKAYKKRKQGTEFMFSELIKSNVMKNPDYSWELESIAERMIDYSNTWLYISGFYQSKPIDKAYIHTKSLDLMKIFYSYLTEKGKREFNSLSN